MEQVVVVHKKDGPVACLYSGIPERQHMGCHGCQAYEVMDTALCVEPWHDCYQRGKLAAIRVYIGTRFEAETYNGVKVTNAIVHSIVQWRKHPLTVYWTDALGRHIETYALTDFKSFKFL